MKAVIVSAQRSGGLFLAGCLSNHPDISCPREEPFRGQSIWQQKLKLNHADLLDFILSQPYYLTCVCRLTYDQIFNPEIAKTIFEQEIQIIHLTREILPTVTSTLLAKQEIERGIPRHWFNDDFQDREILDTSPDDVIKRIKHLINQRKNFNNMFRGDHLQLTYEKITLLDWIIPDEITSKICRFLEVPFFKMRAQNRKMHKRPLHSYYRRWNEISEAIAGSFPEVLVID